MVARLIVLLKHDRPIRITPPLMVHRESYEEQRRWAQRDFWCANYDFITSIEFMKLDERVTCNRAYRYRANREPASMFRGFVQTGNTVVIR